MIITMFYPLIRTSLPVDALNVSSRPEESPDLIGFLRRMTEDSNRFLQGRGIDLEYEIIQRGGTIYVALFRPETREMIQLFPYTLRFGGIKRFSQISGALLNQYA